MAKWSKQTYIMVADALKVTGEVCSVTPEEWTAPNVITFLTRALAARFQADNPNFDYERFTKAATYNPKEVK